MFDWAAHVPRDRRKSVKAGVLSIHYCRGVFALPRHPDTATVFWLLGLYQAEGGKQSCKEWSIVSGNVGILAAAVRAIEQIGVPRDRLYLEVLHHADDSPELARAEFEPVGVEIRRVRMRTKHKKWKNSGNRGGVLHVARSIIFHALTVQALTTILSRKRFPSREAALAFALGWLEGDGSIRRHQRITKIRLCGTRSEGETVLAALTQSLGWRKNAGTYNDFVTERALDMFESCALACAGAFAFSMNRARLIYGLEQAIKTVAAIRHQHGARIFDAIASMGNSIPNLFLRTALLERCAFRQYRLPPRVLRMLDAFSTLGPEMETLRKLAPPERLGKTGVKGAPYVITDLKLIRALIA